MIVPRAAYDPDSIRGIDNPVARWIQRSAEHVTALLDEVDRLRAELDETRDQSDGDRAALADERAEAGLSMRQRAVLASIRESVQRRGYPPTVREICAAVGVTSTSTVHYHLRVLERAGFVSRGPAHFRGILLTAPEPAEVGR
ncbi:MarR family transcriptional regulator [Actinomadura sp. KC06]|nr:MarR family transcriptional regulator [Actinomadura sp. KC06]